ncbi:hypothetical protein, partial [Streptococcus pseudopneumoniae]|uniref:hypothetical protein n=1 Tax=Streptococcus pseudopneumoniae TaxID=257758 RepID=UPI001AB01992
ISRLGTIREFSSLEIFQYTSLLGGYYTSLLGGYTTVDKEPFKKRTILKLFAFHLNIPCTRFLK